MGKNSQRKQERDRQRLLDFNNRRSLAQAVDLNRPPLVINTCVCKGTVVSVPSDAKTHSILLFAQAAPPPQLEAAPTQDPQLEAAPAQPPQPQTQAAAPQLPQPTAAAAPTLQEPPEQACAK